MTAFLDTHAVVFLYEGRIEQFGAASRTLMERVALLYSPVVRLELQLLHELGRLTVSPDDLLAALGRDAGLLRSDDSVHDLVNQATDLAWTRDPFDRLIVATARLHRAPLVTRDEKIRQHFDRAIW